MGGNVRNQAPPWVLTIAGSDPTGGAGIQADLRTFEALGVRGLSVISALTAQDSSGVHGVFAVDAGAFSLQLETILADRKIDAVKTGMLLTAENVRITARLVSRFAVPVVVVDPVIHSSSGAELLEPEGVRVMIRELLPLATVVTPNLWEASVLSGIQRDRNVPEEIWIQNMSEAVHALGPRYVIVTGGHRSGDPVDILFDGKEFNSFVLPRVPGQLHGSGCVFSSALCAHLALGVSVQQALVQAKEYTRELFPQSYV